MENNKNNLSNNNGQNPNDHFFPVETNNQNTMPNYTMHSSPNNNHRFQKLHNKAFIVLLIGVCLAIAFMVLGIVLQWANLDGAVAMQMDLMREMGMNGVIDEGFVRGMYIGIWVATLSLWIVYYSIMLGMIFRHKRTKRKGVYLTVMMVFNIVLIVTGCISLLLLLITFNRASLFISLGQLVAQIVILAGVKIHKKSEFDKLV